MNYAKILKEDITISHIPIVLLTARDDKQSQLSGYKNGADAYLTKPFEIEMLMEIIRNRLKNRESIKKRYLNTGLVPAPEESTFSQADETFLLKLNKIILEHLDSSHLDVTFICKEIGMSRASLYNKLKALTDMGANDYINKFRMEKAIHVNHQYGPIVHGNCREGRFYYFTLFQYGFQAIYWRNTDSIQRKAETGKAGGLAAATESLLRQPFFY